MLPATESLGERACDATSGKIKATTTITDTSVLVLLTLTIFNLPNQEPRNVHIFSLNSLCAFCSVTEQEIKHTKSIKAEESSF